MANELIIEIPAGGMTTAEIIGRFCQTGFAEITPYAKVGCEWEKSRVKGTTYLFPTHDELWSEVWYPLRWDDIDQEYYGNGWTGGIERESNKPDTRWPPGTMIVLPPPQT